VFCHRHRFNKQDIYQIGNFSERFSIKLINLSKFNADFQYVVENRGKRNGYIAYERRQKSVRIPNEESQIASIKDERCEEKIGTFTISDIN
jgi:hypothetical protein